MSESIASTSAGNSAPVGDSAAPPQGRRRWRVRNALVFLALGGLFFYVHESGWSMPKASALFGKKSQLADDWCAEHSVPESICVECNQSLLPRPKEFGFCADHGVAECVLDHPELAQVAGRPHLPRYDTRRALALMVRPENNSKNTLHKRLVQLASAATADKAGIEIDVVHERSMSEALTANGEVTFDPTRVAHLSSRVPGTVAVVFKTVNDDVQPGEILALIDAAQVGQAKSQLLNAVVQQRLRRTTLDRLRAIASGAIPQKALTEAEAAAEEADISFVGARQALVNLGFDLPEQFDGRDAKRIAEDLRFLGISADSVARLPSVTKTTNLLPLRTPYRGVVVASDIVAGEVVDANKLLFTIADPQSMWILLSVRQEDARYVSAGLPVDFRTDDGSQSVSGKISWISPAVDERSRTLRVCVFVESSAGKLRDKTYGTGRILLRVEAHAIVVPKEAVQSTTDAHFVFVRDRDYLKEGSPKLFHVRQVRAGAQDDRYVELLAGVLPGEVVATKGSGVLLAQLLRNNLGAGCGCHQH